MTTLHFAPVQGHTDAAFRHFHSRIYGGKQTYYTPFIRLEKGGIRQRDLKDFTSELNEGLHLVPQIIFRDAAELNTLVKILKDNGAKEIDLNLGCPFPLQTGHGRGAAAIANESLAKEIINCIKENSDIDFSVKMRLGYQDPTEWARLIPYLNQVKLKHIAVHPRVAKQQYSGDIDYEQFEAILKESTNPVIYNGDIKTPEDIEIILKRFPEISGIMAGRGILARPSLFQEFVDNRNMNVEERKEKMMEFHHLLFDHYSSVLCGDSQIIAKIKPFWEYSEEEIGRKVWKAIKKSVNLSKYQTAVAQI